MQSKKYDEELMDMLKEQYTRTLALFDAAWETHNN